jgi:hypothetical protein
MLIVLWLSKACYQDIRLYELRTAFHHVFFKLDFATNNNPWPHACICQGLSSRLLLISIAAEAQIQIQMQQRLPWRIACMHVCRHFLICLVLK